MPTTVSEGRLGLYQDDSNFFIDSPTLGQIPGSNLLEMLVWAGLVRSGVGCSRAVPGHLVPKTVAGLSNQGQVAVVQTVADWAGNQA